jgi:hypothetical protein
MKIYEQCGGITYAGPAKCEFGLKCTWINANYSQCLPDASQPVITTSVGLWQQCGGDGYEGLATRLLRICERLLPQLWCAM